LPLLKVFSNKELAEKYKGVQLCTPLNIFKDSTEEMKRLASQLGMTIAQLMGEEDIPKAELAYKYAVTEPLVRAGKVPHLPTKM
jgi:hypothetical protein